MYTGSFRAVAAEGAEELEEGGLRGNRGGSRWDLMTDDKR